MEEIQQMVQALIPQYYIESLDQITLQLPINNHLTTIIQKNDRINIESNFLPQKAINSIIYHYDTLLSDSYIPTLLLDLVSEIEQIMQSPKSQLQTPTALNLPKIIQITQNQNQQDQIIFQRTEKLKIQKSTFFASSKVVKTVESALEFYNLVKNLPECNGATHNMMAFKVNGEVDFDEDGEGGAGQKMAFLLEKMPVDGVVVVVTRFFGGIKLGNGRFKIILDVMKEGVLAVFA